MWKIIVNLKILGNIFSPILLYYHGKKPFSLNGQGPLSPTQHADVIIVADFILLSLPYQTLPNFQLSTLPNLTW